MKRLLSATETVAAFFLLLIALLAAGNVFLRDVFSLSIPDWYDGSRLLQGIALFWGFALATYYGSHICVDIVWEHLKPPGRRWLDLLATAITLAFLIPMAWMVWVKVGGTGTQGTSDMRMPIVWFYAFAAVGAVAGVLLGIVRMVRLWQGDEAALKPVQIGNAPEGEVHGS
ncbi:MAG: TRAP transporter small permease [Pseudomonadota bacterium]